MSGNSYPTANEGFFTTLSKAINIANPTGKLDLGISEWLAKKGAENDWNRNVYVGPGGQDGGATQAELDSAYKVSQQEARAGDTWSQPKTTTNNNPNPQNTNTGGTSFDSIYNSMYPGWDRTAAEQDWIAKGRPSGGSSGGGVDLNAQMRREIEGGYTDYFNQLDSMFSGLDTQANANLGIGQLSYDQSIADLQANKASSLGDLGLTEQKLQNNQVKSLRDIASNIQNQYMAGNVMLGARGAGDSSAANQYSYALNRVGSKARGDVMNQTAQSQQEIENQKAKLNNIVTQETSRLDTELGKVKLGISEWLAEQQNAVRGMIAEGKLNKGKDLAGLTQNLLNQALSAYQTKAQEISAKKSQLETWAMNNSTNINQLKSNLQSIGQFTPNMPVAGALNGSLSSDAQGNLRGIYGYGSSKEEENRGY